MGGGWGFFYSFGNYGVVRVWVVVYFGFGWACTLGVNVWAFGFSRGKIWCYHPVDVSKMVNLGRMLVLGVKFWFDVESGGKSLKGIFLFILISFF